MKSKYEEELHPGFSPKTVIEEASRCLLCLDAPCSAACPAGTNPGKFIRSVRFRNFKGAAETIRESNALGSICARVCPTEKYCQKGCTRSGIDRPIDIGGIQRFVTDYEKACGMEILKTGPKNNKKVAIVGSGPSALQAASTLVRIGYEVVVYEKDEKIGGYMRYGIPEYRLPTNVLNTEISRIKALGVKFIMNTLIGEDISLEELKEKYDAVLIATGSSEGKILDMFAEHENVISAVSYLKELKYNKNVCIPDTTLVIGGGDVAMDVVTTLKFKNAKKVIDVVYEEMNEFKASDKELATGIKVVDSLICGYVPTNIENNVVTFKHRFLESELKVKADLIVLAVGQFANVKGLNLKLVNNEVLGDNYHTEDEKIFYAGDIAHGEKSVVWAVRTGKEAALQIHLALGGK